MKHLVWLLVGFAILTGEGAGSVTCELFVCRLDGLRRNQRFAGGCTGNLSH